MRPRGWGSCLWSAPPRKPVFKASLFFREAAFSFCCLWCQERQLPSSIGSG